MTLLRSYNEKNGNSYTTILIFQCDRCSIEMSDAMPMAESEKGDHFCPECAFILGMIDEVEYCRLAGGIGPEMFAAGLNPETNKIQIVSGSLFKNGKRKSRDKFSWEKNDHDRRVSPEYISWRTAVFERDDFTCQDCGQRGGALQAHHIKPFARFESLRYEISNGVTLCEACHRNRHRKGDISDEQG